MTNIINLADKKAEADRAKSTLLMTMDVYLDQSGYPWAQIYDVDFKPPNWNEYVAGVLHQLAWYSFGQHADEKEDGYPMVCLTIFNDGKVSTRWNDDRIATDAQVEWIRGQIDFGVKEIENAVAETEKG